MTDDKINATLHQAADRIDRDLIFRIERMYGRAAEPEARYFRFPEGVAYLGTPRRRLSFAEIISNYCT
jgi:hypothetical protein